MLLDAPSRSFIARRGAALVRLSAAKPADADRELAGESLRALALPHSSLISRRVGANLPAVFGRKALAALARRLIVHAVRVSSA
jgi:hypothetical protein